MLCCVGWDGCKCSRPKTWALWFHLLLKNLAVRGLLASEPETFEQ